MSKERGDVQWVVLVLYFLKTGRGMTRRRRGKLSPKSTPPRHYITDSQVNRQWG